MMRSIHQAVAAGALLALSAVSPAAQAEGFTGRDFLAWSQQGQDSYLHTSVTMAGVIASQIRPPIARCIDDWYFADAAVQKRRNEKIKRTIRQHSEFHPAGVLLAVLQSACGSLKEAN